MRPLLICDDCHPAEAVALCARYRCGIEMQSFYDPSYIVREPAAIDTHRRSVADITPRSLHGPFGDLCPGSFDVMVRDLARYRFERAAHITEQLGAQHLILHHGYIPNTSVPAKWIHRCTDFWREFLRVLPPGIHLHIENVFERDPSMMIELVDAIEDPRFDVCLDIGHIYGLVQGNAAAWARQLGTRIGYVHVHDNHGACDEHLGLGRGNAPLAETFAALNELAPDALWALECRLADVPESVEWLENNA